MSKLGENTMNGSSEEVKKVVKIQKDDQINSSKGAGTSDEAIKVGRKLETNMKKSEKNDSFDDDWDEDYKSFIVSGGWSKFE